MENADNYRAHDFKLGNPGGPGRPKGSKNFETQKRDAIVLANRFLPQIEAIKDIVIRLDHARPRYILYAGVDSRPLGGSKDKAGEYEKLVDACAAGKRYVDDLPVMGWWHVEDAESREIVAESPANSPADLFS